MSLVSMTLACLLVNAQAGPVDIWHMNQPRFSIPIRIDPARRAEIKELWLYVSRDQGVTWDNVARSTPDKESFPFQAQGDGSYWFSVAIIDSQGQQEPRDIRTAPVGQKLIIDTRKPVARILGTERKGEEVVVQYEVTDEYLDSASLKMEYRMADSALPHATPVALVPTGAGPGTARFKPATGGGLNLRLSVKDQAGNEGIATYELAPVVNTTALAGNFGQSPLPPAPVPPTSVQPAPVPPPGPITPLPAATETMVNQYNPNPPVPAMQPLPTMPAQAPLAQTGPSPSVPNTPVYGQPLAHSGGLTQVSTVGRPPRDRNDTLSLVEITNKKEIKIDFEVAKFGPSGIGSIDVYMTTDDGRTWERNVGDHKAVLPGPGDPRHASGSLQGSVLVRLPREGQVYGITLVVKSRAGLSRKPPEPGEAPQMRVELDTKLPEAELYAPTPDGARRDTLVMNWKAEDKNLATNPITLEWAPNRTGPWTPIGAAEIPNTGRYNWQVPQDVPPSVYLRLTVRDMAGNSAVAQTQEPVLVDLSIPEVNIIRRTTTNNR